LYNQNKPPNLPNERPSSKPGPKPDPGVIAAACFAEAEALKHLSRVAHASGMPDGGKPVEWLQEHGLIEKVDDGWRFKAAKPVAVEPDDDDIPF
jgi:hypothetical protein